MTMATILKIKKNEQCPSARKCGDFFVLPSVVCLSADLMYVHEWSVYEYKVCSQNQDPGFSKVLQQKCRSAGQPASQQTSPSTGYHRNFARNFQVSLQKRLKYDRNGPHYFHECTGSIIAAEWVLTAANCFNGFTNKPELWQVR